MKEINLVEKQGEFSFPLDWCFYRSLGKYIGPPQKLTKKIRKYLEKEKSIDNQLWRVISKKRQFRRLIEEVRSNLKIVRPTIIDASRFDERKSGEPWDIPNEPEKVDPFRIEDFNKLLENARKSAELFSRIREKDKDDKKRVSDQFNNAYIEVQLYSRCLQWDDLHRIRQSLSIAYLPSSVDAGIAFYLLTGIKPFELRKKCFVWLERYRTREEKIILRITADATLTDIAAMWPWIDFYQKDLPGYLVRDEEWASQIRQQLILDKHRKLSPRQVTQVDELIVFSQLTNLAVLTEENVRQIRSRSQMKK